MSLDEIKSLFVEINNLVLENKPKDMFITTHICRGNYHSKFFISCGAYDSVAENALAKENVYAFLLEYDDDQVDLSL